MKRKFEICKSCPKLKRVFSKFMGEWLFLCDGLTHSERTKTYTEIPCECEWWNRRRLPDNCLLYAECFLEECNEEKA